MEHLLFYLLILFLPTQLGLHFWPNFSSVLGIRVDYLSPTVYVTDVLVGLLIISWVFRKLSSRYSRNSKLKTPKSKLQFKIQNYWPILMWLLVIGYLLLVVLLSRRIEGGLYSLLKFIEMSFVAYYTAKFIDFTKAFQKIIILLSFGVISESAIAIFQFIFQGSIGGQLYYLGERSFTSSTPGIANASLNGELVLRPYGTFPHPNVLAGYLVVTMILILFSLSFRKANKELRIKNRELRLMKSMSPAVIRNSLFIIQVTALVLGTIALFLTMSRVATLIWILIATYFFFKLSFRALRLRSALTPPRNLVNSKLVKNRSLHAFHLVGMTIVLLLAIFFFTPLGYRFTNIRSGDEAIVQRQMLIDSSIKMIKTSPLLGVGLGNFIPTLAKIQKPLSLGLYLQPVHNIFLLVAAETGLIGLGFFTWFLWKTYKRIKKHASLPLSTSELRIKESLVLGLSTILVLGLFDHYWLTLQQGQLFIAFIIGLCWTNSKQKASTPVSRKI